MDARLILALAASSALDAAVACVFLFAVFKPRAARGPVTLGRILLAAKAAFLALLGKAFVLVLLGLDLFGLIHLAYLELFVVVPAVAAALLLAHAAEGWGLPGRRALRAPRAVAWSALVLPLVGVYATWVEPYRLRLETADVALAPQRAGSAPITIGVLADLQTTRVTPYERRAVGLLLEQEPDLILVPGDLYQGAREDFEDRLPAFRELLALLRAPGGVYLVLGNVDTRDFAEAMIAGTAVRLLADEIVRTEVRDRHVTIAGLDLLWRGEAARAVARELEDLEGEQDVRLLLAHYPDSLETLRSGTRVDLVVAGHTHGGQVQLPFLGPPLKLSRVPRRIAAGGLGELDGRRVYVSRGVGLERGQAPRLRFLCPPEVSLLTLR